VCIGTLVSVLIDGPRILHSLIYMVTTLGSLPKSNARKFEVRTFLVVLFLYNRLYIILTYILILRHILTLRYLLKLSRNICLGNALVTVRDKKAYLQAINTKINITYFFSYIIKFYKKGLTNINIFKRICSWGSIKYALVKSRFKRPQVVRLRRRVIRNYR